MEKPPLEKIVEKLEKLDLERWEWKYGYTGPTFCTKIGNLKVYVREEKNFGTFVNKYYHSLVIENRDESVSISYYNKNNQSVEEKEIGQLYKKLYSNLKEIREKRFEEAINEFLSE